jgi:hypothetical protein
MDGTSLLESFAAKARFSWSMIAVLVGDLDADWSTYGAIESPQQAPAEYPRQNGLCLWPQRARR